MAAEAALEQAVEQLTKARILADQFGEEVRAFDRLRLNELTAEAGVLVEQVAGAVAGRDLEGELAQLMAAHELDETQ